MKNIVNTPFNDMLNNRLFNNFYWPAIHGNTFAAAMMVAG
jgi:hypothetical protein